MEKGDFPLHQSGHSQRVPPVQGKSGRGQRHASSTVQEEAGERNPPLRRPRADACMGREKRTRAPLHQDRQQHCFPSSWASLSWNIVGTGKKSDLSRSCVVCEPAERSKFQAEHPGQKRKRYGHESSYQCDTCKNTLCVDPCFKLYHTSVDYQKKYLQVTCAPAPQSSSSEEAGDEAE